MKNSILTAISGLDGIEEVRFDKKSNQFVGTGNILSASDLENDKYKVTDTRLSIYGNSVMIKDDKGQVRRYSMPVGINTRNEGNRDMMLQRAFTYQNIVVNGILPSGRLATLQEIADAQSKYQEAIEKAYMYHSQIGLANKIKRQEFKPYGY